MAFADPGVNRLIINAGVGPAAPTVVLAEACRRGDHLGYSSGWKRGLATVGTAIQARLIALADGKIGDSVPVSSRPVIGGFTGATPGGYVYAAEGTDNGMFTQTAPATTGDCNTILGLALSDTEVMFFLNSRPDSLSS